MRQAIGDLQSQGFEPIELERYCTSNKIWSTKVKRLRLPDLLCIKTGLRVEVRAKTKLQIRMSDAPKNIERRWDAGLRSEDILALIAISDTDLRLRPTRDVAYFTIGSLQASLAQSKLGPPKSASEGAERDRTWPATVPKRDGIVEEVTTDRIRTLLCGDGLKPRHQSYKIDGKTAYLRPGQKFKAHSTIIAGAPTSIANLASYRSQKYRPFEDLHSSSDLDRYAAVKALPYYCSPPSATARKLERVISRETEPRITLEAAGSSAKLGSRFGQRKIASFVWGKETPSDLRMEAVFILAELKDSQYDFAGDQLRRIASDKRFAGQEIRQAAVWGLGKAGLKSYEYLVPLINDSDEEVALHAICAFGEDTPRRVIRHLVCELTSGDRRKASAASQALCAIGSETAVDTLVTEFQDVSPYPDWVIATLGRMPLDRVENRVRGTTVERLVAPWLLITDSLNWLSSDSTSRDLLFLLGQNM